MRPQHLVRHTVPRPLEPTYDTHTSHSRVTRLHSAVYALYRVYARPHRHTTQLHVPSSTISRIQVLRPLRVRSHRARAIKVRRTRTKLKGIGEVTWRTATACSRSPHTTHMQHPRAWASASWAGARAPSPTSSSAAFSPGPPLRAARPHTQQPSCSALPYTRVTQVALTGFAQPRCSTLSAFTLAVYSSVHRPMAAARPPHAAM